jgi:Inorganic Pyrophosphatase
MRELQQTAKITGLFSNISKEDIEATPEEPLAVTVALRPPAMPGPPGQPGSKTKDNIAKVADFKRLWDLDIVIENTAGSIRSGRDWQVVMPDDYGYIRMTEGADGDQLDCYVGGDPTTPNAYVIDQLDLINGGFDEHKVMLGYSSMGDALKIYSSGFHDGRGMERIGGVTAIPMSVFPMWAKNADLSISLTESLRQKAAAEVISSGN